MFKLLNFQIYVMLHDPTSCYVMLCYVRLCSALFCYVLLCYVLFCCVMLCSVLFCSVLFCYVMLCYVMLCYVMLCYVKLCYVMLCYVILYVTTRSIWLLYKIVWSISLPTNANSNPLKGISLNFVLSCVFVFRSSRSNFSSRHRNCEES